MPNCIHFLKEMKRCTEHVIKLLPSSVNKSCLKYGFHAIQTFTPLHMHIVSQDFCSEHLKSQTNWNSFNTEYFIDFDNLIHHLDIELRNLTIDYFHTDKFHLKNTEALNRLLLTKLKCNVCNAAQANLENLKAHLLTHEE